MNYYLSEVHMQHVISFVFAYVHICMCIAFICTIWQCSSKS
uniref:Uncharacterized protein n=1 Tax=Arundo donax TaxID=35708 RepID=A0A0A8ZYV9_ARUDO